MHKRVLQIFSLQNGATTCFQKCFDTSSAPPKTGDWVALGTIGEPTGSLKTGVVSNVASTDLSDTIKVGTDDASTQKLRECLIPDNWEEVPLTKE